jgi:hypothetical protein
MKFDAETVKRVVKKVLIGLVAIGGVILLAKAVNKSDIEDEIETVEVEATEE